jgi:hypothetical protein
MILLSKTERQIIQKYKDYFITWPYLCCIYGQKLDRREGEAWALMSQDRDQWGALVNTT